MDWTYLLTSLEGRINRKPYWIATIALIVVGLVLQFIAIAVGGQVLGLLVSLIFLFPGFALNVKRGYDRNRPLWIVAAFYALLLLIVLMQIAGFDTAGGDPTAPFLIVGSVFMIAAIVLLIDFGFLRGTRGPNAYGEDPLEGQA